MLVRLGDAYGNLATAGSNVTINLASASATGAFFSGATRVTSVAIPAGGSSASFTYEDTTAGTPTLTAAAAGLSSATQPETVLAAAPAKLVFATLAQTLTAGAASAPMTVQLDDQYGNAAVAGGSLTVNLASTSPGAVFLGGATQTASITIPGGSRLGQLQLQGYDRRQADDHSHGHRPDFGHAAGNGGGGPRRPVGVHREPSSAPRAPSSRRRCR